MRVFVVGATGALGRTVLAELLAHSHTVVALARSQDKASLLRGWGVEAVPGDLLAPASFQHALQGADAICNLASVVPPSPSAAADWLMNDVVLRQGTRGLAAAARRMGVRYMVQQSAGDLYRAQGDIWLHESAALEPPERLRSALDAEGEAAEGGVPCAILRGGRYYGPGTPLSQRIAAELARGSLTWPHRGDHWISPTHLFDMAKAVRLCVEQQPRSAVFNVCDDEPLPLRRLLDAVADARQVPLAAADRPARRPGWRLSNERLRAQLGFVPYYPRAVEAIGELCGA